MQCDNNENAITDVIVRLENCIKDISSWMMHNSLQINENKTDFFSTTPHKLKKHTLQVGTNVIGLSKTVKILGVTLLTFYIAIFFPFQTPIIILHN